MRSTNPCPARTDRRARAPARGDPAAGGAPGGSRASLYDEVTARIVAELEAGRVPWVQPWGVAARGGGEARHRGNGGGGHGGGGHGGGTGQGGAGRGSDDAELRKVGVGLPRNTLTGRAYSGINVLILWGAVIEQGFASQGWLTFRQAIEAGGGVRKGEHGTAIVYADRFVPGTEQARAVDTGEAARAVPFLKRFTVFNVAQCDGLRADLAPDPAPLPEREVVPVAERVIAASGVDFRIGGDRAFYAPGADFVRVPPQPAFFDQINYYRTALHELTHATGHPSRLDRKLVSAFGTKDYAREELVAELGSAFLCAALGIVPTVRHADYLASWLDIVRDDNRAIFRAASAASKAADWLLERHRATVAANAGAAK